MQDEFIRRLTNLEAKVDNLVKPEVSRPLVANGRLTLTSATPVLTNAVTAATTVYFTPYLGNKLSLYNGTLWKNHGFSEISVAVPSTVYRLFDVFVYLSSNTPVLETVNWNQSTGINAISGATNAIPIVITDTSHGLSNGDRVAVTGVVGNTAANGIWSIANVAANTFELEGSTGNGAYVSGGSWYRLNETRATNLVFQNGVYVKSGETTKRYLGTCMTTATSGQTEVTTGNSLLWNYYNRIVKSVSVTDGTSHTYTSTASRIYRDVNTNKVAWVVGVAEDQAWASILALFNFDAGDGTVSTRAQFNATAGAGTFISTVIDVLNARFLTDHGNFLVTTGYNFMQMIQVGAATSPDFQAAICRVTVMR